MTVTSHKVELQAACVSENIKGVFWFWFCWQCNGMSNRFWGWGREDDEFYRRLRKAELQVTEQHETVT